MTTDQNPARSLAIRNAMTLLPPHFSVADKLFISRAMISVWNAAESFFDAPIEEEAASAIGALRPFAADDTSA
jgi:hypothetical protein